MVAELCPKCETEVELSDEFKTQQCPNCNESIKPCANCIEMNCTNCPLRDVE